MNESGSHEQDGIRWVRLPGGKENGLPAITPITSPNVNQSFAQRWKKLDKNTRRIQKLKYRFHLFAINGENSLDITEFELMMRDLCVSFAK